MENFWRDMVAGAMLRDEKRDQLMAELERRGTLEALSRLGPPLSAQVKKIREQLQQLQVAPVAVATPARAMED